MWSFFKLQANAKFKSPEMIFPFFFPFVITLLLAPGFESSDDVVRAFGALMALSVMQSGLFGFGFSLIDAKDSVLIKRVGSTKITKFEMIMSMFMITSLVLLLTILFQALLFVVFSGTGLFNQQVMDWGRISWGGFLLGMVIGAFMSLSIGMFFVTISKNQNVFTTYVFLYFFAATFLGGMLVPNAEIPWTRYVNYVIPSSWNSNMIMGATQGGTVFNFSSGYGPTALIGGSTVEGWEAAYNLFMPLALTGLLLYVDTKLFKLD